MDKVYKYGFLIALFVIVALCFKSCKDSATIKDVKIEESNLRKALADTIHVFQTKEGHWGAEKRTLQTDISTLKDNNLNLTVNQKLLIKEVERQNKNGQTIAAAVVALQAEIKGLKNNAPLEQTDSTVRFAEKTADFEYDLTIYNVKPFELKTPTLTLNRVAFPNTQTINFHWKDDRNEGYPISFSVINSNPYYKVSDIQSYAIPELTRENVKPTFWQKVNKFSKSTGGKVAIFGLGVVVGGLAVQNL